MSREFNRRLKKRFDELGIGFPLPQQTVYVADDQREPCPAAAPPARDRPRRGSRERGLTALRLRALVLLACAALPLTACHRDRSGQEALPGAPVDRGPPVPYRVVFDGDLPPDLKGLLPQVSQAQQLVKQPPTSELVVRRRALDDVPRLQAALRSQGYYDGQVSADIEDAAPSTDGKPQPVTVRFRVEPGPLYRFAERRVELTGDVGGFDAPPPNHLGSGRATLPRRRRSSTPSRRS